MQILIYDQLIPSPVMNYARRQLLRFHGFLTGRIAWSVFTNTARFDISTLTRLLLEITRK